MNKKLINILKDITEAFIKDFYKEITQRHNGATGLVLKL